MFHKMDSCDIFTKMDGFQLDFKEFLGKGFQDCDRPMSLLQQSCLFYFDTELLLAGGSFKGDLKRKLLLIQMKGPVN